MSSTCLPVYAVLLTLFIFGTELTSSLTEHSFPKPCKNGAETTISYSPMDTKQESTGIIKMTSYDPESDCKVVLKPSKDGISGLIYTMHKLNIRPNCIDKITVTGSVLPKDICNESPLANDSIAVLSRPDFPITISLQAGAGKTVGYGFDIVFTAYTFPICKADGFICKAKHECISASLRCDGYNHCPDGSDQTGCPDLPDTCGSGFFQCANRICILSSLKCNGEDNCGDGSDEVDCATSTTSTTTDSHKCTSSEFQCQNGECIALVLRCNGEDNCGDGSDEANCPTEPTTKSRSVGQIVGYAIGGILFVSLVVVAVYLIIRARQRSTRY